MLFTQQKYYFKRSKKFKKYQISVRLKRGFACLIAQLEPISGTKPKMAS